MRKMTFYVKALVICCIGLFMPPGSESQTSEPAWLEWTNWTRCNRACDGGRSFRVRECNNGLGTEDCEQSESRPCNTQACTGPTSAAEPQATKFKKTATSPLLEPTSKEVETTTPEWNIFSTTRVETTPEGPTSTPKVVPEPAPTSEPVVIPEKAEFTEWITWSECTKVCGGGLRYRTRTCVPVTSKSECEQVEEDPCNIEPCTGPEPLPEGEPGPEPLPEGEPGSSKPEITSTGPTPTPEGVPEPTPTSEPTATPEKASSPEMLTSPTPTPEGSGSISGEFTEWIIWSECTKVCGGGLRYRTRTCVVMMSESECEQVEEGPCNIEPCTGPEPKPEGEPSSPKPETTSTSFPEPEATSKDMVVPEPERTTQRGTPEPEIIFSGFSEPEATSKDMIVPEPETTTPQGTREPEITSSVPTPTPKSVPEPTTPQNTSGVARPKFTSTELQPEPETSISTTSGPPKMRRIGRKTCGKQHLLAEVGHYKSLTFSTKQDTSFTCIWTIVAPHGYSIKIIFEELKIEEGTDLLQIFEGTSNIKSGVKIATLTNEVEEEMGFYTVTRRMSILMQTAKQGGKPSFRLRYTAVNGAYVMETEDNNNFDGHSNVELWWKLLRYLRKFMSQITALTH